MGFVKEYIMKTLKKKSSKFGDAFLDHQVETQKELMRTCNHSELYRTGWCINCDQKVARVTMFKKFAK